MWTQGIKHRLSLGFVFKFPFIEKVAVRAILLPIDAYPSSIMETFC